MLDPCFAAGDEELVAAVAGGLDRAQVLRQAMAAVVVELGAVGARGGEHGERDEQGAEQRRYGYGPGGLTWSRLRHLQTSRVRGHALLYSGQTR